ncbi:MAG: peroxiredoxin family protein [Haloferacaceae archaeon]
MSLLGERAPEFELASTAGGTVELADTLDGGPTVVVPFRGTWCSFCAEQLETFSRLAYDMHRHQGVDVLPFTNVPASELVEHRDRYDLRIQLLSDPGFEATRRYSGVAEHPDHGEHTRAATYVVDADGVVRYEHVADHSADRTYANTVRYLLKNDYEDVYFGRHDA